MKRRIIRTIAILMTIVLLFPGGSAFAEEFQKGKKGTFWVFPWQHTSIHEMQDNYYPMFREHFNTPLLLDNRMEVFEYAKRMKEHFDTIPAGKRAYQVQPVENMHWYGGLMNQKTMMWLDGLYECASLMDNIFTAYKRMGGPDIDYFFADFEHYTHPWFISQVVAQYGWDIPRGYDNLVQDPRYLTEIRPRLVEIGFNFCEEPGENELKYAMDGAYIHTQETFDLEDLRGGAGEEFLKFRSVVEQYAAFYLQEYFCTVMKKHFPNAQFGNYYQSNVTQGPEVDYFPHTQGHINKYQRKINPGTIICPEYYGAQLVSGAFSDGFMPDYPYKQYLGTVYNAFLVQFKLYQISAMYSQNNRITPWIGSKTWRWHEFSPGKTDYYDESIFHALLTSSQPYVLMYDPGGLTGGMYFPEDDRKLSSLMHEMDELVGFEDRQPLMLEPLKNDTKYILSGMSAGGRNVWRITPDLCYKGYSRSSFLKSKDGEPPRFVFGNQIVEFPEGSYIYTTEENNSLFGYWVISPEGTRPREWRDENLEIMPQPDILTDDASIAILTRKSALYGQKEETTGEEVAAEGTGETLQEETLKKYRDNDMN